MRILVVGAGAVGGYFGGRLLEAKRDVTFLVRESRAKRLAQRGLEIRSPFGDAHLSNPPTITAEELTNPFDLILLSCKAQDLQDAIQSFAPAVGADTVILPLLNGMSHLDDLDARFGSDRVLGGSCFISATRDEEGRIIHFNDTHRLSFGERDGARTARIQKISSTLSHAGLEAHCSIQILRDMWEKWIFIATFAGITCLMRGSIGDIVAAGASDLTRKLLNECAAIAGAQGFPLGPDAMKKNDTFLTNAGSRLKASMLRDVERHAPIEAEHIIGDLVRRGKEDGVPTPLLQLAYAHVRCYEARRMREAAEAKKPT
jgi:2-dehydropantoate 2-reductase